MLKDFPLQMHTKKVFFKKILSFKINSRSGSGKVLGIIPTSNLEHVAML